MQQTKTNVTQAKSDEWSGERFLVKALKEAVEYRECGEGRLYGMADMSEFARIKCRSPVLRKYYSTVAGSPVFDRCNTDSDFAKRLEKHAITLAKFDLLKHGLVLAGGAVCATVMRACYPSRSDLDLFLVGHATDSSAEVAISALQGHLCDAWGAEARVHRTKGCITFTGGWDEIDRPLHLPIQVILRKYATIADVLYDFDLGSSAMAWDGKRVHMSSLGLIAANCGANVLDLSIRRSSYERRLSRYFERGFDIVLPALDVPRFCERPYALPFLCVNGFMVVDDELWASATETDRSGDITGMPSNRPDVYYSPYYAPDQYDPEAVLRMNIAAVTAPRADTEVLSAAGALTVAESAAKIIAGIGHSPVRDDAYLCASWPCTKVLDVLRIAPKVDPKTLAEVVERTVSLGDYGKVVAVGDLCFLLGDPHARTLLWQFLKDGCTGFSKQFLTSVCTERACELNTLMGAKSIPAGFGHVILRADAEMDGSEWYGEAYMGKLY
jgi:hypothetical protein